MSGVFIGTDAFAAGVLEKLASMGAQALPDLVITRPDSAKGRGRKVSAPPVGIAAASLGIETIQPEDICSADVSDRIEAIDPAALSLCEYGAIIREPLLSRRPILNLHPSLLPRWRGAAPIERAIMAGDTRTGVSIIQLVEALDAGPVAAQEALEISDDDDFESLSARLVHLGSGMLAGALAKAAEGSLVFHPQEAEGETYAERLLASDRLIDPAEPATQAERKVRALRPHIGARLELRDGDFLGIRAAVVEAAGPPEGELRNMDGALVLGCCLGALRITRVLPAGGREMDAQEWLRGRPDSTGF